MMERENIINSITELLNKCEDIELLYFILALLNDNINVND